MNFFSQFWLSMGAMLCLSVIVISWLFRTTSAPFVYKVTIPTILVLLACITPNMVRAMMGLPVTSSFADLPDKAELIAFVSHEDTRPPVADLWLKDGDIPRAYETILDAKMKKTLREAQERQARGERTMLAKNGPSKEGGNGKAHPVMSEDITHTETGYIIDEQAFALPTKGGEQ